MRLQRRQAIGPVGHVSRSNTITVAAEWRRSFYLWADTWPKCGPIVRDRKRSALRILRAGMGLADMAHADGALRGPRDWWTLPQLAHAMHLSRNTARDVLAWLEAEDRLTRQSSTVTAEGRLPDARWLVLPIIQASGSILDAGIQKPASKTTAPSVQKSGVQRPRIGTPASNAGIQALDESLDSLVTQVLRAPRDIAEEIKERKWGRQATESVA